MKLLGKSLIALIGLLLILVLAFVFLVDANSFKPRIESLAKDQGIALQIKGDLGWNFWPSLGVAVNDVRVAALETPDQSIADIKEASLLLALMPLFSGEFQVDHVLVDGAAISLKVDASGKGNWEALSQSKTDAQSAPSATSDSTASELKLDIEKISLSNSQIQYEDEQNGQRISLRDINLTMTDANTRAEPFPFDASFVMALEQAAADKMELQASIKNTLSIDNAMSNIKLDDGQLQLEWSGDNKATVALDYSLILTDLQNNLAYEGTLKLAETNARKLLSALGTELETANNNALSKLAFSAAVAGTRNNVALNNLQLTLDDTQFSGSAAVTDFSTSALKLVLEGNELNADDYLPPPAETPQQVSATAAPAEDVELPLEMLRGLNVNAKLALKKLIFNQMLLENVALNLTAKNGIIEPNIKANAYAGAITAKGKMDARGKQAQVQFDADVKGLELAPLLKDMEMDSKFGLQGAIQAQALGSTQGSSVNQLIKALNSNATFSGAQVRVSPINLEQQFCKLVNMVTQAQDPTKVWEEYTELSELAGNINLRNEVVTIEAFNAGVEKLRLGSSGKINLATDTYDILLPFKLVKDSADTVAAEQVAVSTSANGCSVGSSYWLERGMEFLRCKGSFAEINPLSDCRPDKALLTELTKDYAVYKLKEKHGAKYEEKKAELEEKVEKEKTKLFDKLQQSLNKRLGTSAASSAAAEAASEPAPETASEATAE